ncbi:MAG: hydrogenase 4 subunit B [Candidatus Rokuibacteriota bacterium]|nr:MAG: hydrogenase 4 subunit B [Candidatus Rokubacteria bacterium]
MTAETAPLLCLLMVAAYLAGAAGALAPLGPRLTRIVAAAGAIGGAVAGTVLATVVLVGGRPLVVTVPALLSVGGGLALRLDGLGAFFLILVGVVAAPAALYGVGYTAAYQGRYSLRWLGAMLNLFLLTMSLVVLADNALTFLLTWEAMSLTSYFLVMTEHERADTVAAGSWYLAMTHVGLALILTAFVLLIPPDGGASFAELRGAAATASPALRGLVFVLAVLGFGGKAGLVPLHVWLPRAHPAAPSHVSALMSGVMVKLGVYGILRLALDLLGVGPAWWGALLIGLGAASALIGVLYALMEDDLKRLLAYSTVENVGLVFIGVGAGLLFVSLREPAAAVLALAAALYHAVNHGVFKGLLFLGAGSVAHATGSRDMNRLGGLIRTLPWTAACFLVGALSIGGLPPFNGFVSEWLLFQSLLPAIGSTAPLVAPVMTLAVGALALTAGLAAAAFVKAFGITFLALPRSAEAGAAHEAPLTMRLAMVILAVLCALLGLGAALILPVLGGIVAGHAGLPRLAPPLTAGPLLLPPGGAASMSPSLVAIGLLLAMGGAWLAVRLLAARGLRVGETWGCGRLGQTPRMEYTSTAYAEPLRRVFAELYRPTEDLAIEVHPESRYFVQSIAYRSEIVPWFERYLYAPLVGRIAAWAARARVIQSGSAHAYLAYLVVALLALLAISLAWSG